MPEKKLKKIMKPNYFRFIKFSNFSISEDEINVFYLCIILHIFSLFFWKPVFSKKILKQI